MSSKNCLNCGHEITNRFCAMCGQKADTHRITVKHFVLHDLLHGVFHIDKGILFTIKEAFTRPGKAAMDYINGKRISYYNVFYLILLLIGLNLLVQHYIVSLDTKKSIVKTSGDGRQLFEFFRNNIKYIILSFIPLFAFNGWMVFRRLKLNFAEHHILAGFVLLGCSVLTLINKILNLLPDSWLINFVGYIQEFISLIILLFPTYVYLLAFLKQYKPMGFAWRMLLMYFLFFIELIIGLLIIVFIVSDGKFEGGIVY